MLSRRHFLQFTGIAVSAHVLPSLTLPPAVPAFETVYGRSLATTTVYTAPHLDAPVLQLLWSDTISPIAATEGAWYRLRNGYVLRQHLQPMNTGVHYSEAPAAPPFWAEVSGSIADVREWCAVDAPVVCRIGHGGVLHVVDYLPDWYGVADTENGDLLGWSRIGDWSPLQLEAASPSLTLAVDSTLQQLSVHDSKHVLLTAPISTGYDLIPGVYPITDRNLSRSHQQTGIPYTLTFGADQQLIGAYWHNQFGQSVPGAAIQMTPALARWLYPRAAQVIIS